MSNLQNNFISLCIKNQILKFGEFVLKSGRVSPYFFNAGLFNNGYLLSQLARYYAQTISAHLNNNVMLYGPAYKGIPLACATAMKLSEEHGMDVNYSFNRKEAKDHGEGGSIVGAPLSGNVVILDDVITAGTSINESVEIIVASGAKPCAVVIALDRQEIADKQTLSAVQRVEQLHQIPVFSLIKLDDLVEFMSVSDIPTTQTNAVISYRNKYGS